MWIAALVLSVVPFIATLFMDNYYLGDTHNAVENTLVSGEHVGKTAAGSDDEGMPLLSRFFSTKTRR